MAAVHENDLATLIYTSGTTGRPKGVMLNHKILRAMPSGAERLPIDLGHSKALSFLPCVIYERMLLYMYQYCGVRIHFAESLENHQRTFKEVPPSDDCRFPVCWKKYMIKSTPVAVNSSGIKRKLFSGPLRLVLDYEPYGQNGWWYELKLKLAPSSFSKMAKALGGNLKAIAREVPHHNHA